LRKLLIECGVPDTVIRYEDKSASTWQNVEFTRPYLREALESGLAITAISKWYHRRTLHSLTSLLPDGGPFYAISWEPVYAGRPVTRAHWPDIPDGSFHHAERVDGAWCC
jgi:uncharacterized SAM-binding protein YcdF (DUF218 family)